MSSVLSSILDNPNNVRLHHPLILLQSSTAQTCSPVLHRLINLSRSRARTLLFCFLYPPSDFIDDFNSVAKQNSNETERVRAFDYTSNVPGYTGSSQWMDPRADILQAVENADKGPINVIIDSVDTLVSDLVSNSESYNFIHSLLKLITGRQNHSVLILHSQSNPLLPLLTQVSFSPSLAHILAHPPSLFTHIADAYLTSPPSSMSSNTPEKFWSVFIPISERAYESERLVFGENGSGSSAGAWIGGNGRSSGVTRAVGGSFEREFVVEILLRGGGERSRRSVDRTLEGWKGRGPCSLEELESLKSVWKRRKVEQGAPNPMKGMSFNLALTPAQEKSRAQVPLPYAHEGQPASGSHSSATPPSTILYDPDSADDIDDDDPDEDLDI